ncbi:MAG: hypothetical protein QOF43_1268 [Gaiellaceae bacterium]|nr:hypothetical protein [Gaiellaceae bacterium]
MAIPVSLLVMAIGAILAFAVTDSSSSINVHAVGWILMGAGLVGLVLAMIMWDTWAGGGYWRRRGPGPPTAGPPPPGPPPPP